MELTVIGCSGSVPGPDSPASAYLVRTAYEGRTFSLLLDLGSGAYGRLALTIDPRELDAVALSHLHPDHCIDLCALYVAGRYSPTAPWPRIPVHGPTGTATRLQRAYEASDDADTGDGLAVHFDFRDWQPTQQLGPFLVEVVRVAHPVEAYAIRVRDTGEAGGTLVYSGDTGPTPALVELARGADLLLIEASFLDGVANPPDLHLTGAEAARIGAEAGVGQILLTHIPPWHDRSQTWAEAAAQFAGPIALAESGASVRIGHPR